MMFFIVILLVSTTAIGSLFWQLAVKQNKIAYLYACGFGILHLSICLLLYYSFIFLSAIGFQVWLFVLAPYLSIFLSGGIHFLIYRNLGQSIRLKQKDELVDQ